MRERLKKRSDKKKLSGVVLWLGERSEDMRTGLRKGGISRQEYSFSKARL